MFDAKESKTPESSFNDLGLRSPENFSIDTLTDQEIFHILKWALFRNELISRRRKEGLIHALEKPPDKTKMIKSFSRSAAGKNLLDPKSLRPPEILLKTVNYLLTE